MNFIERVKSFWHWFAANEEKLSDFAQNRKPDPEFSRRVIEFVGVGTALIGDNIHFNIGGDYEFAFSVSGNHPLFFLLPYVTANLPKRFQNKWTFFPCMPGTCGQNFGLRMYGVTTYSDNVMVSVNPNKDKSAVNLQFYAKEWDMLEERDCYNAFYTLTDICIGENLLAACIGEVEKADELERMISPQNTMLPLTQLEGWLLDNLCENGKPQEPARNYHDYRFEPLESPEPRLDIFTGSTSCIHLAIEYYTGEESYYHTLLAFGAKPIFLSFCYNSENGCDEVYELRSSLTEMLEYEVLGERGSGDEIGVMLGWAMGLHRTYIDILLFDEQAFIKKAKPLLEKYEIMFFVKDFERSGYEHLLFDHKDSLYVERLNQLHRAGFHGIIVQLLEALPVEEKNDGLTGIYARALNNVNELSNNNYD